MKEFLFEELAWLDAEIYDLNARVQSWREGEVYEYISSPRERSGLMYLSGCGAEFEWQGGSLTAGRGSLVFLPQRMNYRVTMSGVNGRDNAYLANFCFRDCLPEERIIMISPDADELASDFRELAALYVSTSASPLCFKSRMYSLLWRAVNSYRTGQKASTGGIGAALRCMEEDPTGHIGEPRLAALCGMSVPTLIRTMKLYTGMTPKQYSLSLRIKKAKELLTGGIYTVNEISELLGFSSPSHFCATFRKSVGVPPGEYAKKGY